jgi:hypothetical protein
MSEGSDNSPARGTGDGAAAALAGYGYQLNVSIFAAFKILFVTKSATRITLEPANADDIEVELEGDDPGHVEAKASLGGSSKLIVQVKLRGGDPWSLRDFERLLKHGKRRTPAKDHLNDPDARYLLVTNADVTGEARNLLVEDFEERPDCDDFPASLRSMLTRAPEGRVAIFGGLSAKLLNYEIEHILTDVLRVPKDRQSRCLAVLREEAEARMRGTSPGVWAYNDLLGTIRAHGGFLASVAELDAFVEPTNFPDMIRQLEKKSAVIITGSSGTGKTLTARALCDQARKRNGALDIVVVNPHDEPSSIRQLVETGPKLFYLEDPWGQYSLRAGSEAWTEQLPRILRDARAGSLFIATSRNDMLRGAQAVEGVAPWLVELEADNYLGGRFATIYDKRMDLLPPKLQSKALSFRSDVLQSLEKPLELDLFFAHLAGGPQEGENDGELLRRLIGLAHRDAVEGVVGRYLTHADKTGHSAVIWGILAARSSFDRSQLTALMRALRAQSPDLATGLDKLVDSMVAARHLRQPTTSVAFAHPSVRAGFERHLKGNWFRYEPAVISLLIALTKLGQTHADWGLETAARLIDEVRRLVAGTGGESNSFEIPLAAQTAIDSWLEAALVDAASDFPKVLQLASDVGSTESGPSELARWFLTSVQRGSAFFFDEWKAPTFADEWYERISQDERSFTIADRFVRDQLFNENGAYGTGFPAALDRIVTGLDGAYLEAARRLVGTGHGYNIEAIVEGAVRDLVGFEAVVEEALDDLAGDDDEAARAKDAEKWRSIVDGECDYGFEEYYNSGYEDEGYSSAVIIERYIAAVRESGAWEKLAKHRRSTEFGRFWVRDIRTAETTPSVEEMSAAFAAAKANECEDAAWDALWVHWLPTFRDQLKSALSVGILDQEVSRSAVACALAADENLLVEGFAALDSDAKRITLLCAFIDVRKQVARAKRNRVGKVLKNLEPELREIGMALVRGPTRAPAVSTAGLEVLRAAATAVAPCILAQIVPLMIQAGDAPAEAVRRWLSEAEDKDLASAAANAAVKIKDETAIELALHHRRANARVVALKYLSSQAEAPFPPKLLSFAGDPGHRVRRALAKAVALKPHPKHFTVLMRLTGDKWSDAEPQHNEDDSFPIAREATAALTSYGPLSDQDGENLINLGLTTTDRKLSQVCLNVAASHCSLGTRKKIRRLIGDRARGVTRLDALNALVAADTIEPELLAPFTAERIMEFGPALATSATAFVCRHANLAEATAFCERMAHSNAHRSLALLGAALLHGRDAATGLAMLNLLPDDHPARQLFDVNARLLPATVLDDLGDVKLRRWVRLWLSDRIAKE